jgi:hypothetical protein
VGPEDVRQPHMMDLKKNEDVKTNLIRDRELKNLLTKNKDYASNPIAGTSGVTPAKYGRLQNSDVMQRQIINKDVSAKRWSREPMEPDIRDKEKNIVPNQRTQNRIYNMAPDVEEREKQKDLWSQLAHSGLTQVGDRIYRNNVNNEELKKLSGHDQGQNTDEDVSELEEDVPFNLRRRYSDVEDDESSNDDTE